VDEKELKDINEEVTRMVSNIDLYGQE